jgi:hypothetical protein
VHQGVDAVALLSLLAALAVPGCRAPPDTGDFGEPVALDMEGSATMPAFRVAFRARVPADPHALVNTVAGLAHDAMAKCPDFAAGHRDLPGVFALHLEGGMVHARSLSGERDVCFSAAMEGRPAQGTADIVAQVTLPEGRDASQPR